MPTSGKEQMLSRVREALGRTAFDAGVPKPLPPFHKAVTEVGEPAARFVSELERVGASAAQLGTPDELKEHLAGLLPADTSEPIALSDSEAARGLGLRAWLAESGRPVIPTLREFIAEELRPGASASDGGEVAALAERHKHLLLTAAVGITAADYALSDTGTLVLVSGDEQHRLASLLPPAHVCLLDPARILPSLSQLLAHLRGRFGALESAPKNVTCITGPSRTADIEQAITMGVHGPKSLHVILYPTAADESATTRLPPPPDQRERNGAS